jgi:hypothetical protein
LEDFFMLSRRGFLIATGGLLTTAFVKDARSFTHRHIQPLLTSPPQVVETMYWCEIPDGLVGVAGGAMVEQPLWLAHARIRGRAAARTSHDLS